MHAATPHAQGGAPEPGLQGPRVEPKATDAKIKRAYRRLLSQHHSDKLVSKELPKQMLKLATEKTHEIRRAYETTTRARDS